MTSDADSEGSLHRVSGGRFGGSRSRSAGHHGGASSPIDTMDDEPRLARSMRRLRVVRSSDPLRPSRHWPFRSCFAFRSADTRAVGRKAAIAVLDAADARSAVILASSEASPVGLLCAATHPDRVEPLSSSMGSRAIWDHDYPEGVAREVIERSWISPMHQAMVPARTTSPGSRRARPAMRTSVTGGTKPVDVVPAPLQRGP